MIVTFEGDGKLTIKPETDIENYALKHWWESWSNGSADAILEIALISDVAPNKTIFKEVKNDA